MRAANPFTPPAPAPGPASARGCIVALAAAGAVLLAAAGLCTLVAGTERIARAAVPPWPATWGAPASARPPAAARRLWGEIRARYRGKDLVVPA